MSDTSRTRRWWRRFRSLPRGVQIASWAGLAVVLILGGVFGGESDSGTSTVTGQIQTPAATATAPAESPTTSPALSPSPTTTPSPTPTVSLAQWRAEHGQAIVIVISTAHGLVTAIDGTNELQFTKSCNALKNNYRDYLVGIPDPPGPLSSTWNEALDNIYAARRDCAGGIFFRKPDLYRAQMEARTGIRLLNEVLGPPD